MYDTTLPSVIPSPLICRPRHPRPVTHASARQLPQRRAAKTHLAQQRQPVLHPLRVPRVPHHHLARLHTGPAFGRRPAAASVYTAYAVDDANRTRRAPHPVHRVAALALLGGARSV